MKNQRGISRRGLLPAGLVAAGTAALGTKALAQTPAPRVSPKYPVLDTADVLVVGGGPAGLGAALGAAHAGAKVLLIENCSFFGGIGSWQVGMPFNQIRPEGKPRSFVHELLLEKTRAYGDQAMIMNQPPRIDGMLMNVEYLKVGAIDALDSVGARYLVHMRAADSIVENNRVTGVVVATKRGLMAIRAACIVDCTGDADVAWCAGVETMTDPKELMPVTLGLVLTNIDKTKVKDREILSAIRQAKKKYPLITAGFMEMKPVANSTSWWINHAGLADQGRIDATDPVARSKAECDSRRQIIQMITALRESGNPALAQIELATAGPQIGVRETRRIKGVYVMTEDDALTGRVFEDAIAWRNGMLDPGGTTNLRNRRMKLHDLSYRALLPEKVDGLLVAGRCLSQTHVGAGCGKAMGNYMATGHAAGIAAAIAARQKIQPREVKVREIQDKLRADGVDLNIKNRDQDEHGNMIVR